MDLKGILSVSGYSDLFKLVAQSRNGIIVESLLTKKRMQAFASSKISSLEDIAIYTTDEDIPLHDVFKNIFDKENGGKCVDSKSDGDVIKNYFETVLPVYDKERVYLSDMKRVLKWYNMLQELNMLEFSEKVEESKVEEKNEKTEEEKTEAVVNAEEKKEKVEKKEKAVKTVKDLTEKTKASKSKKTTKE